MGQTLRQKIDRLKEIANILNFNPTETRPEIIAMKHAQASVAELSLEIINEMTCVVAHNLAEILEICELVVKDSGDKCNEN
jgi:hypothetical protein